MAEHPYPAGTRVRHYGQQWTAARVGTATVREAFSAAWMVASALAAWIVVGVVAVTVGLYAVVVAGWGIWRVVRAAWTAMAPRTDSLPPLADERPAEDREPPDVSRGRSGPPLRPTPTWARKDAA